MVVAFCSSTASSVFEIHVEEESEAIEVLIFTKAYVVKKVGGRSSSATANHKTGQVTWTKFGGAGPAWAEAKARANF